MNRQSGGCMRQRVSGCARVMLALTMVVSGCGRAPEAPEAKAPGAAAPEAEGSWAEGLLREREAKDAAFRSGSQSPIPAAGRADFAGLSYYPVDPALRFSVQLQRYEIAAPVRMGTNTGEIRDALHYGRFEFRAVGGTAGWRSTVWRRPAPSLFIPFGMPPRGVKPTGPAAISISPKTLRGPTTSISTGRTIPIAPITPITAARCRRRKTPRRPDPGG